MSIEDKIEQRKQEAEVKQIGLKARTVARYLGNGGNYADEKTGSTRIGYDWGFLVIESYLAWECTSDGLSAACPTTIKYKRDVVFSSGKSGITTYVPGRSWENHLNKAYARAEVRQTRKFDEDIEGKLLANAVDENINRANWGI